MPKFLLPNGNTIVAEEAFVAAHFPGAQRIEEAAPSLPRRLTKLEFFDRFLDTELVDVYTAAETSAAVRVWLDKLKMTTPDSDGTSIDLADSRTVGGVNAMEYGGLIAAGRAAEILA